MKAFLRPGRPDLCEEAKPTRVLLLWAFPRGPVGVPGSWPKSKKPFPQRSEGTGPWYADRTPAL